MATVTAVRPGRGFTLLELLVAASVMVVALALTLDLVSRAQQQIDHAGARALDLPVELVFDRLRRDVRTSRSVEAGLSMPGLWSRDPLVTSGRAGGDVAYALVGGELVRHPVGATDPADRVRVLADVRGLRWRRIEGTARASVEIEVTFGEAGALTARAGAARAGVGRVRTERLVVTPRDLVASWW